MASVTQLKAQLSALDHDSRRALILANLNKFAPLKVDLHKFSYEMGRGASPDHWRGFMNGAGHTQTASTCKACWEYRLRNYGV